MSLKVLILMVWSGEKTEKVKVTGDLKTKGKLRTSISRMGNITKEKWARI